MCKQGSCHPLPPPPNRTPSWTKTSQSTEAIQKGGTVQFHVQAKDPDGDTLRFSWKASTGTFEKLKVEKGQSKIQWKAPKDQCKTTVTVTAKDKETAPKSIQHTFVVTCKAPTFTTRFPQLQTTGMVYDPKGQLYLSGTFSGTLKLGNITLQSAGAEDYLVLKLGLQGEVIWASRAGGRAPDKTNGIAIDSKGDVYITGIANPEHHPRFGDMLVAATTTVGFIAKLDGKNGKWLWVREAAPVVGYSLLLTKAGNEDAMFIAGPYHSKASIALDRHVLDKSIHSQLYIAKVDKDGKYLWVATTSGSRQNNSHLLSGVVSDKEGNAYIASNMDGTTQLGEHVLELPKAPGKPGSILVAKINKDGKWVWGKVGGTPLTQATPTSRGTNQGIAVDAKGNTYITGIFMDTTVFGKHTLTNPNPPSVRQSDIFVVKLNVDGTQWEWAKRIAGKSTDSVFKETPASIVTDDQGRIFVSGLTRSTNPHFGKLVRTFDGTNRRAASFIAKLTPTGDFTEVKLYHGPGDSFIQITRKTLHMGMLTFAGTFSSKEFRLHGKLLQPQGMFLSRIDADTF